MRRRPNQFARKFDALRARSSPIHNAVIDEFLAARIGRRELLRFASVLGMSAPLWWALTRRTQRTQRKQQRRQQRPRPAPP
jgi:hypothetical protein